MELKVQDVTYGAYTFGPYAGQRVLVVNFEETEESTNTTLVEQMDTFVTTKKLDEQFFDAINGQQKTFFVFTGTCMAKADYEETMNEFFLGLSRLSLDLQQTDDLKKINMGQLKPPYMIFHGTPDQFSGLREFYQNFNTVTAVIEKEEDIKDMALMEMTNHQFSSVVYKVKDVDELPKSGLSKVFVLDMNKEPSEDLYKACISKNFRYYFNYVQTDTGFITVT